MRLKSILKLGVLATAAVAIRSWLKGHPPDAGFDFKTETGAVTERRAEPDPEALAAASTEVQGRVGLDLDRLKSMQLSSYKPLVEYLSYIQVQRGEDRSLVFVRQKDLHSLAALTGEDTDSFVEEFKQLGVLLSMN